MILLTALALTSVAQAQLNIPSDGSDGDLIVTEDTVIDLGQATAGQWDANNSARAGRGVYDASRWAVIFKYRSVRIAGRTNEQGQLVGATLRFRNHPTYAPVVWLVREDVIIDGVVWLQGEDSREGAAAALIPSEPGPGGFRGGVEGPSGSGRGSGPGAAAAQGPNGWMLGAHASFYGNPRILPLIGGSPSWRAFGGGGGSAGGGAILIATPGEVKLTGRIDADGGGISGTPQTAAGGAIRIVAGNVSGNGELTALRDGRIRIEAGSLAPSVRISPETIAVPPGETPVIWPPSNAPTSRIVSVDQVPAPLDPTSPLLAQADIPIQNDSPVVIVMETRNFPLEGVVEVRIAEKFGPARWERATRVEGGSRDLSIWQVTTRLAKGFNTLQVRATAP